MPYSYDALCPTAKSKEKIDPPPFICRFNHKVSRKEAVDFSNLHTASVSHLLRVQNTIWLYRPTQQKVSINLRKAGTGRGSTSASTKNLGPGRGKEKEAGRDFTRQGDQMTLQEQTSS